MAWYRNDGHTGSDSPIEDFSPAEAPGARVHLAWPVWKVAVLMIPVVALATVSILVILTAVIGSSVERPDFAAGRDTATSTTTTTATSIPVTAAAPTSPAVVEPPVAPTAPPTVATTQPSAPTWDEMRNASIPSMCTHPPARLVDGVDRSLPEAQGYFELQPVLPAGTGLIAGLPGPRGPVTAVVARCSAGGVAWPNLILLFGPGGVYQGFSDLIEGVPWEGSGMYAPGRDGVTLLARDGGRLVVYTSALQEGDMECCATMDAYLVFSVADGHLVSEQLSMDVGD